jgi:hypothetical protein
MWFPAYGTLSKISQNEETVESGHHSMVHIDPTQYFLEQMHWCYDKTDWVHLAGPPLRETRE